MARVMARPGVLRAAASIARNGAARTVHNVRTTGPCLFRSVCILCACLRAIAESRLLLSRASGFDGLLVDSFVSSIEKRVRRYILSYYIFIMLANFT